MRVELDKADGGKRPLSIPAVRDRVLQTAVTIAVEAEFEDCSFAYRKGRSVEQAVARIQLLQRQGFHWVVDADIERFFESIDHALLMSEVGKLVDDAGILRVIRQWLNATVVDGNKRFELTKGVPQGSPIAPLLSNLYLDHLDEALLDTNVCLVRFADDFLLLCKSRDRAEHALELTDALLRQLRLKLNTRKTRIVHFNQGFRFLGVQFIRSPALKTEADPVDLFDLPTDRALHSLTATALAPLTEPQTIMQLAFSSANLSAENFPATEQPVENLDCPEIEDLPADHEPLLRTLYLLQHGQVLGGIGATDRSARAKNSARNSGY